MNLVITGLGAVTPVGNNLEETWNGLVTGRLGGRRIESFDPSDFRVQIAAPVKDWDPLAHLPIDNQILRTGDVKSWMSRAAQFAVSAAHQATVQAKLDTRKFGDVGGLWLGNGGGGISGYYDVTAKILQGQESKVRGEFMIRALQNMIGAWATRVLGLRGPTQTVQTACASSIDSIATAVAFMTSPVFNIKYAVVIGAEAAIDQNNCAAFAGTGALSTRNNDPAGASRPFSADRDGFVMGECAGAIVLEEESFAKARGAKPLARLAAVAVGSSGGGEERGPSWLTEPNAPFCAELVRHGMEYAGWLPESVDLWVAHGTSTRKNDKYETAVIKEVFGEHAYDMLITAIKSMIGHGLGGAGILNVITGILSILNKRVPPTMNYYSKDPECDLDYVPNKSRQAEINRFIAAALGFGDQNGFVFAERFDGWKV